ncbi:hypothetical protein ACFY9Q_19155 [Streptomyces sp. NPDC012389]|uniref:hypothetical protein n=1 Tax=unclassified Streptomyces TaxID=2593676 RepID=UPI00081EF8CA|nr:MULTISPECIES: hypothetical protein [unclassified Streptomyces]SCD50409.1 hypothetical protein GA0115243_102448 [Streptomyces sp. ScaeMP-e83]
MTTASLPRNSSRPEPAAEDTAPPQHHGLFLEPRFAAGLTSPDDDEDLDAPYEAPPAPTTSAREPERSNRRQRRR